MKNKNQNLLKQEIVKNGIWRKKEISPMFETHMFETLCFNEFCFRKI